MRDLHIMLDIEALGLVAGSTIIELGAVAFSLETGERGKTFHRYIEPRQPVRSDPRAVAWHLKMGTYPLPEDTPVIPLATALAEFAEWMQDLGQPVSLWSWGSTYDFPLLEAAYQSVGMEAPWHYWQTCCARSLWRLAFPTRRTTPRPHHALKDAEAACGDLLQALGALRGLAAVTMH